MPRPVAAAAREPRRDLLAHREAILDAAQVVFTREEGGSMVDVAAASGLTRATVYRHFADRDALLDGLVGRIAGPMVDSILADLEQDALPDAMARMARRVAEFVGDHRRLVRLVGPRLETLARDAVDDEPLTAALRRRRTAGELDVPMTDGWLAACVRALCLAAATDERPVGEVADDLAETLRRLVG